jgi:hypothetical protein
MLVMEYMGLASQAVTFREEAKLLERKFLTHASWIWPIFLEHMLNLSPPFLSQALSKLLKSEYQR